MILFLSLQKKYVNCTDKYKWAEDQGDTQRRHIKETCLGILLCYSIIVLGGENKFHSLQFLVQKTSNNNIMCQIYVLNFLLHLITDVLVTSSVTMNHAKKQGARKSSYVNARGIPTAAYQVLHLLSYPRGVPHPWMGVPPSRGTPLSWLGYPSPILTWDQSLGYPPGNERTWDQWKYYGMEMEYPQKGHGTSGSIMGWRWVPSPLRCEQTENITSRIVLRTRSVIIQS